MKKRIICASILLFLSGAAPVLAGEKLVAYPVPLNPSTQSLKLTYQPSLAGAAYTYSVEIADINGDRVFIREYSDLHSFVWKGYNDSGTRVKPGLYIVKVRRENTATGDQKTDTARILVKR
ncbi:MAG: FlgD immunoglobulin-like domain containing protein [Spirochaetota bacterium]